MHLPSKVSLRHSCKNHCPTQRCCKLLSRKSKNKSVFSLFQRQWSVPSTGNFSTKNPLQLRSSIAEDFFWFCKSCFQAGKVVLFASKMELFVLSDCILNDSFGNFFTTTQGQWRTNGIIYRETREEIVAEIPDPDFKNHCQRGSGDFSHRQIRTARYLSAASIRFIGMDFSGAGDFYCQ